MGSHKIFGLAYGVKMMFQASKCLGIFFSFAN